MLKKTITYVNPFTEQDVSEEHYFHISKADLVSMEMEEHGAKYTDKEGQELTGMQAKLQRIVESEDGKAILAEFKDIIRRAYGKKDGDRFIKSREIWEEFEATEAYSQLIFDLCTNATASAEFMNGIIPRNLNQIAGEIRAQAAGATDDPSTLHNEGGPSRELVGDPTGLTDSSTPRVLTQAEVVEMDSEELKSGLASGKYKLS